MDTLSGWVTGTVGTNAEGQLVTLRARLRVVAGPDQGQEAILEVGTATIGTGRDAALRLTDRSVSRRHVELALLAGGARVRDLGSRNGTFSRGARIDVATLPLPFELRVGSTRVEVIAADVPVATPVSERTSFGALVGRSVEMRRAFALLERLAATDTPILFGGPEGVGTTALAAATHHASGRTVDRLYYLDRTRDLSRAGIDAALAAAAGGTLILEQLDAWPRTATDALVAALDAGRGDVRLLSTAREDLRHAVEEGRFPRPLYFFLGSARVWLPPLSERPEDVTALLQAFAQSLGRSDVELPVELVQRIGQGLPGNARQLRGLVEAALSEGPAPAPSPARSPAPAADASFHDAKQQVVDAFERGYLEDLMARHDGVVLHAAEEAGLGRNHLARLLRKHGLK
ncbi:MAG: FHA domain-containing protein [Sandaracinaceae bacterium]|nr:FHA domain-containing protein [Sandaracinaceae bacterium]